MFPVSCLPSPWLAQRLVTTTLVKQSEVTSTVWDETESRDAPLPVISLNMHMDDGHAAWMDRLQDQGDSRHRAPQQPKQWKDLQKMLGSKTT